MCALVDSWLSGLKKAPCLRSSRLYLRSLCAGDIYDIQRSIDDTRVAYNLSFTPHPYTLEMAENWIRNVNVCMANNSCCYWTICSREGGRFIGSMGLSLCLEQSNCEVHYWINADEWNKGYCTEAAKRTIMHAFEDLKMHRVHVTHREGNDASKIVIQKCGFVFEGAAREAVRYFDTFKNVISYGILANEYLAMKKKGIYSVQ